MARVYALFPRLEEPAKQPAGTLSGGEQQMPAIGSVVVSGTSREPADDPAVRRVHLGAEPASP
ncbi:MAG: hypothetical protein QOF00_3784 [Pseudonocardiales bacterium]|jgi:branched-chain amino acid transport system ATP-binding protein|nr:hypothetical protein [Pseudonocardiales bacterium]